jgi:hypothetical protein
MATWFMGIKKMEDKKKSISDRIYLAGISVTFWNEIDNSNSESITLKMSNNGVDNLVVMETKKWSASDVASIVSMLRKFEVVVENFICDSDK